MLSLVCILLGFAENGGEFVAAADSAFGMSEPMCAIWFGILVVKKASFV